MRGFGSVIVGDPKEIADQLEEWMNVTDADGFNLAYAVTPGTFEDIVKWVVPELQARGLYRTEYEGRTLRENLGLPFPTNRYALARGSAQAAE